MKASYGRHSITTEARRSISNAETQADILPRQPVDGLPLMEDRRNMENVAGFPLTGPRPPVVCYFTGCPAAAMMSPAISCGWEISERWLAFTSIVLAPMRLAMKRSRSGLIVRSSVETA